jgi:hypothetical protein
MVMGMSRHRLWAIMGIMEAATVITLALTIGPAHGLVGVGLAIAVPGALCRGLVPMVYGCHLLGVSMTRYWCQALLPGAAVAAPTAVVLALLTCWQNPESWLALVSQGAGATLCFLAGGAVLIAPALWGQRWRSGRKP